LKREVAILKTRLTALEKKPATDFQKTKNSADFGKKQGGWDYAERK
jgi:hypothetical protein